MQPGGCCLETQLAGIWLFGPSRKYLKKLEARVDRWDVSYLDTSTHHYAFERRHTVLLLPRHVTHVDVRGTAIFQPSRRSYDSNTTTGLDGKSFQRMESNRTGSAASGRGASKAVFSLRYRAAHCSARYRAGSVAVKALAFAEGNLLLTSPRLVTLRLKDKMRAQASALIEPRVPGQLARQREPLPPCLPVVLTPRRHQHAGRIHDEGVH